MQKKADCEFVRRYLAETPLEHRKHFAQFFTPEPIAEFMAEWVLKGGASGIFDPAFGLGAFATAAEKRQPGIAVRGMELDERILQVAQAAFPTAQLRQGDYLQEGWNERYDAIVCNPPYQKFQQYENLAGVQTLSAQLGIHLSGLTNLCVLFLLKSLHQLKPGGRCAYILPSEFLNSDYGVFIKCFLLREGSLRHVLVFDFESNVFEDALTTACILLFEKRVEPHERLAIRAIHSVEDLREFDTEAVTHVRSELDPEVKWRQYYQRSAAAQFGHLVPFSTFGKVSRGIATGSNAFFVFNESKRRRLGIPPEFLLPCISRAADVRTPFFTQADFEQLKQADRNVFLLNVTTSNLQEVPCPEVRRYLERGEAEGVSRCYLTSKRNPWFALEARLPSPVWVTVFNRNGLRFVRNLAGVRNLTTFHCVYWNALAENVADLLFAYLQTPVSREIFDDNRREYGNGLKKFEPNDINHALVADVTQLPKRLAGQIRQLPLVPESLAELDAIFRQWLSGFQAVH